MDKKPKPKPMHNYKTDDQEIISPVTLGQVTPETVVVPRIDTRVQNLVTENPFQGRTNMYSGDIIDMTYTSKMDQRKLLEQTKTKITDLESSIPGYNDQDQDPTFP